MLAGKSEEEVEISEIVRERELVDATQVFAIVPKIVLDTVLLELALTVSLVVDVAKISTLPAEAGDEVPRGVVCVIEMAYNPGTKGVVETLKVPSKSTIVLPTKIPFARTSTVAPGSA